MKVGDNAVFYGQPIQTGTNLATGKFPLVVLSHGLGGNQYNISWISSALVAHGYIVAGVNHPGTTSGDLPRIMPFAIGHGRKIFRTFLMRCSPIPYMARELISKILRYLAFRWGVTSLQLAGARTDLQKYRQFCADEKNKIDCQIWQKSGIDLSAISADKFGQSLIDKRVKRVIAIDPP